MFIKIRPIDKVGRVLLLYISCIGGASRTIDI